MSSLPRYAYSLNREVEVLTLSQPTAQFYGEPAQRRITITEGEQASLPLRLIGEEVSDLGTKALHQCQRLHSSPGG